MRLPRPFVTPSCGWLSVLMVTALRPPLPRPSPPCGQRRSGVTLLELLVVLVILGVTAMLVVPAVLPARAPDTDPARELVTSARRTALTRGAPVRLRLESDGNWTVAAQQDGAIIDTGRVAGGATPLDLGIDARGTCMPVASGATAKGGSLGGLSFDPLACRTSTPDAPTSRTPATRPR